MKRRDFFKFAAAPVLAPMVVRVALTESPQPDVADAVWAPPSGNLNSLAIRVTLLAEDGTEVVSDTFDAQLVGSPWTSFGLATMKPICFRGVTGGTAINQARINWGQRRAVYVTFPHAVVPNGGDITLQFPGDVVASDA